MRTPEQQAVVDFIRTYTNLHLMVDARAGSGKTTTIVDAAQEIDGDFLAVAFNKKIATELQERLPSNGTAKTLNAIGHGAWWGKIQCRITLNADKMYQLVKKTLEHEDFKHLAADRDSDAFQVLLACTRGAKSVGLVPKGVATYPKGLVEDHPDNWEELAFDKGLDWNPDFLVPCRKILHASIREAHSGNIDFDDQIYMSALFGGTFKRWHTVIVDESQDLSPLNHLMLQKMVGTRLIMVGDPFQAIYGFRGADSNSMTNLASHFGASKTDTDEPMARLGLTYSFRCPKVVTKRQLAHVPDFKSHESTNVGQVQHWPLRGDLEGGHPHWSIHMIPERGAILCRNNAPLMKLAFALIKARRPVTILGRDIGTTLANLLTKIVGKAHLNTSAVTSVLLVHQWADKECEKLGDKESKKDGIRDREECLVVLLEASGGENAGDCVNFIKDLFTDKVDKLTLSSGHRSKGLEWDWVMHLDPWRVPSRGAKMAEAKGNPAPMQQELNLKYVIETRTKDVLVLASSDDCEEIEQEEI